MRSCQTSQGRTPMLLAAGLPIDAVTKWDNAVPKGTTDFSSDRQTYSDFWLKSAELFERLPDARRRDENEQAAAAVILETARQTRTKFLRAHVETVYDILTEWRTRPVRVQHLVVDAADTVQGLVPSAQAISAEDGRLQRDRSGIEIDQGLLYQRCWKTSARACISATPGASRSGRSGSAIPARRHRRTRGRKRAPQWPGCNRDL